MSNELEIAFKTGFKKEANKDELDKEAILSGSLWSTLGKIPSSFASKMPNIGSKIPSFFGGAADDALTIGDDVRQSLQGGVSMSSDDIGRSLSSLDDSSAAIGSSADNLSSPFKEAIDPIRPYKARLMHTEKDIIDKGTQLARGGSDELFGLEGWGNVKQMRTSGSSPSQWLGGSANTSAPSSSMLDELGEGFDGMSTTNMGLLTGGGFLGGMATNPLFSSNSTGAPQVRRRQSRNPFRS